jgi:hypothetical protein
MSINRIGDTLHANLATYFFGESSRPGSGTVSAYPPIENEVPFSRLQLEWLQNVFKSMFTEFGTVLDEHVDAELHKLRVMVDERQTRENHSEATAHHVHAEASPGTSRTSRRNTRRKMIKNKSSYHRDTLLQLRPRNDGDDLPETPPLQQRVNDLEVIVASYIQPILPDAFGEIAWLNNEHTIPGVPASWLSTQCAAARTIQSAWRRAIAHRRMCTISINVSQDTSFSGAEGRSFTASQYEEIEKEHTEVLTSFAVGDYVELHNLKDNALNGQMSTVINKLPNGRIRVRLGPHLMARIVSAKAENVRVVHARATIEEIQRRRDQGQSVRSLLADGFSVGAIQRDDSEKLCSDCCRPRVMCSCTCGIK